jgi:hypothetical protein
LLRRNIKHRGASHGFAVKHAPKSDQQMDADGDQTRHIRWRAEAGANCPLGHNAPTLTLVSQLGRTA